MNNLHPANSESDQVENLSTRPDSFLELTREDWDAIVVGAGPAGAMAARETAKLGLRTLLVDKAKFPRFKVCGCCLNQRSLSTLSKAGLGDIVGRLGGVDYDRVVLSQKRTSVEVALPIGKSLSREAFDWALIEAAIAEGVSFLPGTSAHLAETNSHTRALTLRCEAESIQVAAKIVLAADGLGGRLLVEDEDDWVAANSRIGAGTIVSEEIDGYPRHKIYMACGEYGYVGVVRLEDDRLDVAAALDASAVRQAGGLAEAANQILRYANLPTLPMDCLWKGTPLLTRRKRSLGAERVLVLGDAAGYVEPFTGEGIAWALSSGVAVAKLAEQAAQEWTPSIVEDWSQLHRQIVGRRQWLCRWSSTILRSPWLTRMAISALRVFPALARPVTGRLNER
jgi:flavin-dependent dehydrogenase